MSLANNRNSVKTFPTPDERDVLFYTLVDTSKEANSQFEYGMPWGRNDEYAGHLLVYAEPAGRDGTTDAMRKLYWMAPRQEQDLYNFEYTEANIGDVKFKSVKRSYLMLREDFDPDSPNPGDVMVNIPEDVFTEEYILIFREQGRPEKEFDSIFVSDDRIYMKRVPIADRKYDPESGTTILTTQTLYHRGELVEGVPIEDLILDLDNEYWKGDGADIKNRNGTQLSDEWFAVDEVKIGLATEPKLSRLLDPRTNAFYTETVTPVQPGTIDASVVGDVYINTQADDYLRSQKTEQDYTLPGIETVSGDVDDATGALVAVERQAIVKGSEAAGFSVVGESITKIDGDNAQLDQKTVKTYDLPSEEFVGYGYDEHFDMSIKETRQAVRRGTVVGSKYVGGVVEIKNHNVVADFKLGSELFNGTTLEGAIEELEAKEIIIPASFNYNFPRTLNGVRIVYAKAWAAAYNEEGGVDDVANASRFYVEMDITEPTADSVQGRIIRKFRTNLSDISDLIAGYPTYDWHARQESFGILNSYWFAQGGTDTTRAMAVAHADAQQISIPATVHNDIYVDVSAVGVAIGLGSDTLTQTILLPATSGYGEAPGWITIDVDVIPRRFGIYEIQIKQVNTTGYGLSTDPNFGPITPGAEGEGSDDTPPGIIPPGVDPDDLEDESYINVPVRLVWQQSWNDPGNNMSIQIATNADFSTVILEQENVTGDLTAPGGGYKREYTFTVTDTHLDPDESYWWRVKKGPVASVNPWQFMGAFHTMLAPTDTPVIESPAAGVTLEARTVTLSRIPYGVVKEVEVDDNDTFTTPGAITQTLTAGATYYVRGRWTNGFGNSPWSATTSFIAPSAPTLIPAITPDAPVIYGPSISFTLDAAPNQYYIYHLSVDNGASVNSTAHNTQGRLANITGMATAETYNLSCEVESDLDMLGPDTVIHTFTTSNPYAPVGITPADTDTVPYPTPITVFAQPGALLRVQAHPTNSFTSPAYTAVLDAGLGSAQIPMTGEVWFRVRTESTFATSSWTTPQSYWAGPPIARPVLDDPDNGTSTNFGSIAMLWDDVAGADTYDFEISLSPSFTTLTDSQTGLATSDCSFFPPGDALYYWRTRGVNAAGNGPWSLTGYFTKIP